MVTKPSTAGVWVNKKVLGQHNDSMKVIGSLEILLLSGMTITLHYSRVCWLEEVKEEEEEG